MEVIVKHGNVEKAMRIFKKKVKKSGLLQEIKERQFYTKPSERRKLAKQRAIARAKKEQREREAKL